ncbi:Ig-like domain-containing protein, partial [Salmonella enterica subsp. enterica serovar Paratyphi B]|uniref:Ig-like domain-containing protein n=1 Tax=Salmonella enterica TaxID=28901 RepID=UPI0030C78B0D
MYKGQTQSATPGVWDYTWLADVGEGKHTLTVEATDKAGNKTMQQLDFIIYTLPVSYTHP